MQKTNTSAIAVPGHHSVVEDRDADEVADLAPLGWFAEANHGGQEATGALRRHHESATVSTSLLRAPQRDRCREPRPFSRVLGADSERRARVTATALATIEKPRSACAVYYNTAC